LESVENALAQWWKG